MTAPAPERRASFDSFLSKGGWHTVVSCVVLVSASLSIGLYDLAQSGAQWVDDGSRYANAGAMVCDWLRGGEWGNPYDFAKKNYAQFPAFNIPYHPPMYPLLLGSWFAIFGLSYESARCFMAVCLFAFGSGFCAILRRQGFSNTVSIVGALVLISTPEIAKWSRSTMSELPALMFIMWASYCFVRWVDTQNKAWSWVAFLLAACAFLCRVSTAAVLPGWFLFLLTQKDVRRILSPHVVAPALAYLLLGVAWAKFASSFAEYEIRSPPFSVQGLASWSNLTVWIAALPSMVGEIILGTAICGVMWRAWKWNWSASARFWSMWFVGVYLFQIAQNSHFEARYFIWVVPAICGVAIDTLSRCMSWRYGQLATIALTVLVLGTNTLHIQNLHRGLTGHDRVAEKIAQLELPGNVLLCCWADADLMFRYRCWQDATWRQMIRGDRVLAIRLAPYSGIAPKPLAEDAEDVVDVIRRGRIRYLVTCSSSRRDIDNRPRDMILAHVTASSRPSQFTLLGEFPLFYDFGGHGRATVYLWRFDGDLPAGESELAVNIPTANMVITSDVSE